MSQASHVTGDTVDAVDGQYPSKPSALQLFFRSRSGKAGLFIVGVFLIVAVLAPWMSPADPNAIHILERAQPPTFAHPFGTDDLGRDVWSRVLYGARVSLQVALTAVSISLICGVLLGAVAGYYRGAWDEAISRTLDILFAFPDILLAIAITGVLGPGIRNAMIAIAVVYTPIFARVARGAILQVREELFVESARSLGAKERYILFRHVLPNAAAPILVQVSVSLGFAILAEAALSFLGLGTQPPDASWGRMLSEGRQYLTMAPWMGIFPGLATILVVMGFNFIGEGFVESIDPKLRKLLQ